MFYTQEETRASAEEMGSEGERVQPAEEGGERGVPGHGPRQLRGRRDVAGGRGPE